MNFIIKSFVEHWTYFEPWQIIILQ